MLCKHERVFQFQYHSAVPIPATQYVKQIKILNDTDISKDDEYIHPQFIKTTMRKRRKYKSNFQPQLFTRYCLDCETCNFTRDTHPGKHQEKHQKDTSRT